MSIKLAINNTRLIQGFYTQSTTLLTAYPDQVVNVGDACSTPVQLEPVANFIDLVKKRKEKGFYIQRTFALGDTLMAVPPVRYCQKLGWDVRLRAHPDFLSILDRLNIPTESCRERPQGLGISTDFLLERDVGDPYWGKFHRVDIYLMALGLEVPHPWDPDWSCDLQKFPPNPVEGTYVVFQGMGSNKRKWLEKETILKILKSLNDNGIKVIYIGEPRFLSYDHPLTTLTERKFSKLELFPVIAGAKCLLTMDSGPLWISHFTVTPTVLILGPAHGDQRISYHPLYPEGAIAIQTNEWIGCKTCADGPRQCKGDITCLRSNPDRLVLEVTNYVKRFWEA